MRRIMYPGNAVRIVNTVILVMLLTGSAQGQYNYSKADKDAVSKNRKAVQAAYQTYDRSAFYKLGLFFESIYKKYKDTSMKAALQLYEASTFSEGELYDDSFKAAFRLGQIYETGYGTPVSYDKALIYYLISGEQGKAKMNDIIKKRCPADTVLKSSLGVPGQKEDSLIIRFHPFCRLSNPETLSALNELAAYLKTVPQLNVKISIAGPEEFFTAYYETWKLMNAYERICAQIRQHLLDKDVEIYRLSYLCHKIPESVSQFTLIISLTPQDRND